MLDKDILRDLCEFTGFKHDSQLTEGFVNGFKPNLLNYDKLDKTAEQIPVFQKYLIGFESFILWNENPPLQYYDIFRSCRHTLSLRFLHFRIPEIKKIKNHEERIRKLLRVTSYDEFESVLFELFVGAKYASLENVKLIEFLPEGNQPTPDLFIQTDKDIFVECKRMNRSSDYSIEIRSHVRKLNNAYVREVGAKYGSILFSTDFRIDPRRIDENEWINLCKQACVKGFVETSKVVILTEGLTPRQFSSFKLYPSAQFYEDEYDFIEGQPWQGITHVSELSPAYISGLHYEKNAASTILDSVGKEFVLKWKLSDPSSLSAYTKINFSLAFKGLKQLKGYENTILHFAFERDKAAGHRQESLFSFCDKMAKSQKDKFGWIIFNELQFSLSRQGRLDLQEHGHILGGPTQFSEKPLAVLVSTNSVIDEDLSEFGIGAELPDIDSLDDPDFTNTQYQNSDDGQKD